MNIREAMKLAINYSVQRKAVRTALIAHARELQAGRDQAERRKLLSYPSDLNEDRLLEMIKEAESKLITK